ncbi:hypothetical protein E2C01_022064 [Portunus trituberculatus]|uniref:Uncharacterized protein n=1 Tax=Portunus trituberculatus TaxID=210409 RepID=A0A5B7E481_PORTR|nr:hypothetical protein [Portunus trituberculatus]
MTTPNPSSESLSGEGTRNVPSCMAQDFIYGDSVILSKQVRDANDVATRFPSYKYKSNTTPKQSSREANVA